jgi:glycosyltransferase involved in cell wall biosynthesis
MTSKTAQTTTDTDSEKVLDIMVLGSKPGKGDAHIDKFIPSLQKMEHKITFVGWDRHKKSRKTYCEDGVRYEMIFRGWGYGGKKLFLALPLWCIKLYCYLLFKKPDLIIAIDLDCAFSAAMAKIINRVPLMYIILDTYALRPTIPPFLRSHVQRLDNIAMKKSDSIIVPDETRIMDEYKQKEKFSVVYNCCNDISDTVPAERKDRAGKPFTILATGKLLKIRGVGLLLDAYDQMPDLHLIMAGYIQEKDVEKRIKSNPNINFLGRVPLEDALRLYFDVDVVFTFYDPCSEINRRAASNKWSDSMMASRPILINSELMKARWIEKNNIGYLCPYGDVNALVKCLNYIKDNPNDAKNKGENGRKLFLERYNWLKMEERLQNVLLDITSKIRSVKG